MRRSSGAQLTTGEVAGIRASSTPISGTNPIVSTTQLASAQLTADELAGLHAAGIAITATNPPVTQKELGMNAYTIVTKTADDTAFSLTGVASRTKYVGDTRDCVGHTWINYWATGTTPASLGEVLATFAGAGAGYMTLSYTIGEPYGRLYITGSITNPDYDLMSLESNDYAYVIDNAGGVARAKIQSVSDNRINIGCGDASGFGSALCISPKYLLSNSTDIVVSANQDIYFKGFRFNNTKIVVYGKATFENCVFDTQGITVTEGGTLTFVGYCNTFYNISSTSAIRVLRNTTTMTGQITVMKTTYSDPSEFKMAAIQAHTGAKVISTNSRSLWTAFGIVAESGANVVADNYTAIKTYRDGLVSRGGHIYANNVGLYRGTSGYCAWNYRGSIHIPNRVLHNEGGTITNEVFADAIDDE